MSTVISANRRSVWRALTDPAELIRWDCRILDLLEPVENYPSPGQLVRWKYRLGQVPVVMRDRPIEVSPNERIRSTLGLGLLQLDTTHSLVANGSSSSTRLSLKVVASNTAPVVGGSIDRFDIRRIASDFVDSRLRSLKNWLESSPPYKGKK